MLETQISLVRMAELLARSQFCSANFRKKLLKNKGIKIWKIQTKPNTAVTQPVTDSLKEMLSRRLIWRYQQAL